MEEEKENFFARRTESLDAPGIARLVRRSTESVFGRINVEYIIERANLGISLAGSESGDILAHASLLDYPAVTSVDPARWEHWIRDTFTEDLRASPINTLFLHLFVAKEGFQQAAITEILRIAFVAVPLLQYIILTTASGTSVGSVLQTHFSAVPVKEEGSTPSHLAYVTHRHQHFPVLHIRPARVEDTDDLMPIFSQYSHDMADDYGEFFLAELIESQDSEHKTFVAEESGRAIGFISVTTQVDLGLLNSCFQLQAYHSLKHTSPPGHAQASALMSQSVRSIAGSDQLEESSTNVIAGPAAESTAQGSDQQGPGKGKGDSVAALGSQSKLSSSSLSRLAQIAQMTSSKSRISQSKSKLATTTHTKGSHSKTTVTKSKTKVTESKTTVAESTTTVAESKTKVSPSKSQLTESKASVPQSPTKVEPLASKTSPSRSPAKASQSAIAASESGAEGGLSSSNVGQSSHIMGEEGDGEGVAPSTSNLVAKKSCSTAGGAEEGSRLLRLAGQPSAVIVQLFAIDDRYEMRSGDLLPAVFQAFPDHDFCLLSLPHTVPEFPLLSHFTRVPPRVHCTLPQELYVLHKCSLLHSFVVRPPLTSDLSGVEYLLGGLEGSECVMADVVRSVEGGRDGVKEGATPLSAMVAECAGQVVGVAVVRREEELLFLRSHYNIEDYLHLSHHAPEEHGRLFHLILSPAFSSLAKHFIKEVLRQSHMTSLYYPLHPSLLPLSHPHKPHTVTTALAEMVPVRSRRQVAYPDKETLGVNQPLPLGVNQPLTLGVNQPLTLGVNQPLPLGVNQPLTLGVNQPLPLGVNQPLTLGVNQPLTLGVNQPLPQVLEDREHSFTLYHINRKLSLEPKTVVNSRVVVVGASDTGLSLLETLVFSPHLAFTNLVLVSPTGLPTASSPSLTSSCCYWPATHSLMGLSAWVHSVHGSMVAINREDKQVVVQTDGEGSGEAVVPYDHLVLCTGLQFSLPPVLEQHSEENPLVYDANEGLGVAEWMEKYLQPTDPILLYGSSLEAYAALWALLDSGVAPELISFVQPRPPSCFNNPTVEQRVQRSLEEVGVAVFASHTLHSVQEGRVYLVRGGDEEEGKELNEDIFVDCQAVICMDEKHVSSHVFSALNAACLVFDRRLVIDTGYRTNDPDILAAGPMAKFSRKYHADQWTPANFNSKEIGQKLAAALLSQLDPTAQPLLEEERATDPLLLPSYTQPKSVYTTLPGGLHYLHIEKPNLGEGLDVLKNQSNYGQELVTDTDSGYFRVHVNGYSRVQTITVLSSQPFEVTNYQCLYNVHEKYLNNLVSRYEEGLIHDFFTYFREPWACAVFHDRFPDLREEVRELLSQPADGEDISTEQRVRDLLNEQQMVSLEDQKERLLSEFSSSSAQPSVQQQLHRYLHYNHYHLPMYARPDLL